SDKDDMAKTTLNIRMGSYVDIDNNHLSYGPASFGPDNTSVVDSSVEWVVFSRNTIDQASLEINSNSHHFRIVNNVLKYENHQLININPLNFDVNGTKGLSSRYIDDIQIVHNAGTIQSSAGVFIAINNLSKTGSITLTNNLFVAPNL